MLIVEWHFAVPCLLSIVYSQLATLNAPNKHELWSVQGRDEEKESDEARDEHFKLQASIFLLHGSCYSELYDTLSQLATCRNH